MPGYHAVQLPIRRRKKECQIAICFTSRGAFICKLCYYSDVIKIKTESIVHTERKRNNGETEKRGKFRVMRDEIPS